MTEKQKTEAEKILAIQKGYVEGEFKNDAKQVAYYKGLKDMFELLMIYEEAK